MERAWMASFALSCDGAWAWRSAIGLSPHCASARAAGPGRGGNGSSDLAHGKTAMTIGSPADMATLFKDATPAVAKVWRTALMPTMPGYKLIVPPGGGNAVIF